MYRQLQVALGCGWPDSCPSSGFRSDQEQTERYSGPEVLFWDMMHDVRQVAIKDAIANIHALAVALRQ